MLRGADAALCEGDPDADAVLRQEFIDSDDLQADVPDHNGPARDLAE